MTSLRPIVMSGPSGGGKSTLLTRMMNEFPDCFAFSVSRKLQIFLDLNMKCLEKAKKNMGKCHADRYFPTGKCYKSVAAHCCT
jgi:ABC-type uncharacterized transport system YnjBCD ATPase subunit